MSHAFDEYFLQLYPRLRALAGCWWGYERSDHTLTPTAVVHEAYLALRRSPPVGDCDVSFFLACAARAIHQHLIDSARAKACQKRNGRWTRVDIDYAECRKQEKNRLDIFELIDELRYLEKVCQRAARVAEMKLFGGMSTPQIATVLGVSPRTVSSDWRFARAALQSSLAEPS